MGRLRFLADEHVPSLFVSSLRSNGFEVAMAQEVYGHGTADEDLMADCADSGYIVLTHDRDFVRLADERDHAGALVYDSPLVLVEDPLAATEAAVRIDDYYDHDEFEGVVEWLDGWY